jgi:D-sedoheptulose 7-phosphate isomerase
MEPVAPNRCHIIMSMLEQRIQQQFFDSADLQYQTAELLSRPIADAVQAVLGCLTAGGKVIAGGHGPAVHDVRRVVTALVGGHERERPGLAAVSLSTDTAQDDHGPSLAHQVQALGAPGDVLLLLSAGPAPERVLSAIEAAHQKDMTVIALTAQGSGPLAGRLTETDVHIAVPHARSARVQELHLLCDALDVQLLGEQDLS